MLGDSKVSTYCKGQAVIALSSGEAEYCGLVSAVSQTIFSGIGDGSSMPTCGWTRQLVSQLEADECSDD